LELEQQYPEKTFIFSDTNQAFRFLYKKYPHETNSKKH
jgi:hypothetical protein